MSKLLKFYLFFFIESSEDNKSNNNSFDKDWWLREHQPHSHKNHDGQAFMEKIQEQKARIQNKIQQGEKWLANTKDIPEECIGKIRSAIGKANLLLDKKFQQFQKLCEDSIVSILFSLSNDSLLIVYYSTDYWLYRIKPMANNSRFKVMIFKDFGTWS